MSRRAEVAVIIALLAAVGSLAGCLKPENAGPFWVENYHVTVNDPYNLTVHLAFHNSGEQPLTPYKVTLNANLVHPNGSRKVSSVGGHVSDYPGRFGDFGPFDALFNHTELIPAGAWRNLTVHLEFRPDDNTIEDGDLYRLFIRAEYYVSEVGEREHNWTYTLPCFTLEGIEVEDPDCERLFIFQ